MALNIRKLSGRVRVRRLHRFLKKGLQQKEIGKELADNCIVSHPLPRARDWSKMPIDLCRLIAERITFSPHLHKFATSCKTWCTITKEILDKHSCIPPVLFLPYNEKTMTCRFVRPDCHSMSYDLKVPELNGQWICGCTNGWLAIMDDKNLNLALFHPLTRVKVSLPRFDSEIIKTYLKYNPKDNISRRHPTTWPRFAEKIVISDNPTSNSVCDPYPNPALPRNCLVGVIFTHDSRLAICRVGDYSWSVVTSKARPMQLFSDLIFYEGKLYAVQVHHVIVVDYNGPNDLSIKKIMLPWKKDPEAVLQKYIVMSSGDLLVVERYWLYEHLIRPHILDKPTMTDDFIVYKMDQQTETWNVIENLQRQSLFLGLNSSMSISASDKVFSPWCRENCIYFLDDSELRYRLQYRGYQWDNGIFSMEENCVVEIFRIKHSISFWRTSPMWFFDNR